LTVSKSHVFSSSLSEDAKSLSFLLSMSVSAAFSIFHPVWWSLASISGFQPVHFHASSNFSFGLGISSYCSLKRALASSIS